MASSIRHDGSLLESILDSGGTGTSAGLYKSGAGGSLAQAVVSLAVAVGVVVYYRSLRRRWDKPC
jgi:hypothetical protein